MSEEIEAAPPEPVDYVAQYGEDTVEQAKLLGWKPSSEWQGDKPAGFIDDPKRWVDRAFDNPAVKSLKEQMGRIEGALTKQNERMRTSYEAHLKEINSKKAEAEKDGDFDTYVALDRQEDQIRQSMPETEAPKGSQISPVDKQTLDRWAAKNEWLGKDTVKSAAAQALYSDAERRGMTDVTAILDYVDRGMKSQFVDLQEHRMTQPKVGDGLVTGSPPSAFSKLPAEARQAFDKFYSQGAYGDIEKKDAQAQYAEDYGS